MHRRHLLVGALGLLAALVGMPAWAGVAEAVARLKDSVVLVGSVKRNESPRFLHRGAGFIVGAGDLVVTTVQAVPEDWERPDAPLPVVQLRNPASGVWQMAVVSVLEVDPIRDLALLRLKSLSGAPLRLGDSARVREGEDLAFTGFPLTGSMGYAPVTHRAMVSSITSAALPSPSADRLQAHAIRSLRQGSFDIFQLDATAHPGNSGGPLFDPATGEVVGVMNLVMLKATREAVLNQPSGISYAIPSRYVAELVQRHMEEWP